MNSSIPRCVITRDMMGDIQYLNPFSDTYSDDIYYLSETAAKINFSRLYPRHKNFEFTPSDEFSEAPVGIKFFVENRQ